MSAPTVHAGRWTDSFLDEMRLHGDALAENALAGMLRDGEIRGIEEVFRHLNTNDGRPPHTGFPSLESFSIATHALPPSVDTDRIARAEVLFMRNAFPIVVVLLAKSLPQGYAAPNLSIILNVSGNLRAHPYHRLLSVLQMVLNVASLGGFTHGGAAIVTAQKVRLLHAGIRHIVDTQMPGHRESFGVPVNMEDMLATVMGFSYLVIDGMRTLNCGLTKEEEEDLFYLWRVFALLCGIHPPGDAHSMLWIPDSIEDAAVFYSVYARRHYVDADRNPDGVALALANLSMLRDMIPPALRWIGFGLAPRVYMQHLNGEAACRRVGIQPVSGHRLLKAFFDTVPYIISRITRFFSKAEADLHVSHHHSLSRLMFQRLIDDAFGHAVTFTVPVTIKDFHGMV